VGDVDTGRWRPKKSRDELYFAGEVLDVDGLNRRINKPYKSPFSNGAYSARDGRAGAAGGIMNMQGSNGQ
jgi:hypothetical protein